MTERLMRVVGSPLLWVTLIYLVVELSFSARLLDVVGGNVSKDDIDHIETYGRMLSGFALGLVLLPVLLKRNWFPKGKWLAVPLLFIASMWGMYSFQEALIKHLTHRLSDKDLKNAVVLALAPGQIATGKLMIGGLDLEGVGFEKPAAKAFVALFPPLFMTRPKLETELEEMARQVIQLKLKDCIPEKNGHAQCMGTEDAFFNNVWLPVRDEIKKQHYDLYEDYKNACSGEKLKDQQARRWRDYTREIKGVSNDAEIKKAVYAKVESECPSRADQEFKQQLEKQFPSLKKDSSWKTLDLEAFFALPEIQEKIRDKLGVEDSVVEFRPASMTLEQSRSKIYNPLLSYYVDRELAPLRDKAEFFREGAVHGEKGVNSAERLIVPALALFFSLLGGITHLFKSMVIIWKRWSGMRYRDDAVLVHATPRGSIPVSRPALAAVLAHPSFKFYLLFFIYVASWVMVPQFVHDPVTSNQTYKTLKDEMKGASPFLASASYAFDWIIQTEHVIYPANDWIRKNMLFGFAFGVTDS